MWQALNEQHEKLMTIKKKRLTDSIVNFDTPMRAIANELVLEYKEQDLADLLVTAFAAFKELGKQEERKKHK